ncbi:MAG TPA: serine--tRNA ligase [Candidatus Saccharimonadales bacterium]|nr:serine--tRNA ligase [Candidatus Saccharimonadales bacterium]
MLSIQFIRENPELVKTKSKQKGYEVDVDRLVELDTRHQKLLAQIEPLRHERNQLAEGFKGNKPSDEALSKGKQLRESISALEEKLKSVSKELNALLYQVPNMPLDDVPIGSSEDENVVAKTVGDIPKFSFKPKTHWQIGEPRGWIDKERAARVAGSRFAYIMGDMVRLQWAMMSFAMDQLADENVLREIAEKNNLKVSTKPFKPTLPPAMAKTEVYEATGRLDSEQQTYRAGTEEDDLWLNASAEHTLAPMYINEIIDEDSLPLRYVGYTTAFRREAGTYGKDMEGVLRMHQFDKLEMESFTTAETSLDEHLFHIAIQEHLMQKLELPYRVLMKCTADIGKPNARGVDLDVWLPGQDKYRESHTADHITDYQTRAMKTRVRRKDGKVELAHTNDATALSQRPLLAIIENFQQEDGTVKVPGVLQSYMNGKKVL